MPLVFHSGGSPFPHTEPIDGVLERSFWTEHHSTYLPRSNFPAGPAHVTVPRRTAAPAGKAALPSCTLLSGKEGTALNLLLNVLTRREQEGDTSIISGQDQWKGEELKQSHVNTKGPH